MGRQCLLFVYGLLQPGLSPPKTMTSHWPDAVRGVLYDLGPYPGLVQAGKGDNWVEGYVVEIDVDELPMLDDFEDTESGEYVRRAITTREGHIVWVYEYAWPLPESAKVVSRWTGPTRR